MEAGWHQDPSGRFDQRYHDGRDWTDHVARGGEMLRDEPLAPPPPVQSVAVRSVDRSAARPWTIVVLVGGALAGIAAFMPWAKASAGIFSASKDGIDGDGQITVIVGVIAAIVALVPLTRSSALSRRAAVFALILGLVITAIGIYDYVDVSNEPGDIITPGTGLYLTIIAGALVLVGAIGVLAKTAD